MGKTNKENKFKSFYKAWQFLSTHKIFEDMYGNNKFEYCISIDVVKVNPLTETIDDNFLLNTSVRVWLEAGKYNKYYMTHDIDLDCGSKTFEGAIVKLANLVYNKYGR